MRRSMKWMLAMALALALAACGGTSPGPSALVGRIVIGGSGGGYPVLQIVVDQFTARNPGVAIEFRPSSTTYAGIQQAADRQIDVASIGREPTTSEARPGTEIHWAALDGVAIAVHPGVKLDAITAAQLRDVYAGKIRDWSALGIAGGGEIVLIDRPEGETAKIAIRRVLGADLRIAPSAVLMPREADAVMAVEKTSGAIGYYSVSYVLARPGGSRMLALDGVLPQLARLQDGTYPVTRPIGIVVSGAALDRSPLREFVAFVDGGRAATALGAAGFAVQGAR